MAENSFDNISLPEENLTPQEYFAVVKERYLKQQISS